MRASSRWAQQEGSRRELGEDVTPVGIEQITRRSLRYFKRTIRNVVVYKEAIDAFVGDVKRRGFESLLLVGKSDLDFVVEYACTKHGLAYLMRDPVEEDSVYYLYSEDYIPDTEAPTSDSGSGETAENRGFLQEYLVG